MSLDEVDDGEGSRLHAEEETETQHWSSLAEVALDAHTQSLQLLKFAFPAQLYPKS